MMAHPLHLPLSTKGFTIIESIWTVAIIGIVSSAGFLATSSTIRRTENVKLRNDVTTLNRAVQIYLANGGDLSTATDSQDVLARLKTTIKDKDASRFIGLTSSMSDLRITAIYQDTEEARSNQLRTTWDFAHQRFILGNAGEAAIKRFVFDEYLADDDTTSEKRYHSTGFRYSKEDLWIWDFEDRPRLNPTPVTTVSIYFNEHRGNPILPVIPPTDPSDPGPGTPP